MRHQGLGDFIRVERRRRDLEWLVTGVVVHQLVVAFSLFIFIYVDTLSLNLVVNTMRGRQGFCC